ncbi:MAG TPA: hypothetical protein VFS21_30080 [Roseiflexaceae bacterium]|nr:hypothetical protein [Roseiflexaceae bacterium]
MLLPRLRYRTMLLICLVSLLVLRFVPFPPPQDSAESFRAFGGAARALVVGR